MIYSAANQKKYCFLKNHIFKIFIKIKKYSWAFTYSPIAMSSYILLIIILKKKLNNLKRNPHKSYSPVN